MVVRNTAPVKSVQKLLKVAFPSLFHRGMTTKQHALEIYDAKTFCNTLRCFIKNELIIFMSPFSIRQSATLSSFNQQAMSRDGE